MRDAIGVVEDLREEVPSTTSSREPRNASV